MERNCNRTRVAARHFLGSHYYLVVHHGGNYISRADFQAFLHCHVTKSRAFDYVFCYCNITEFQICFKPRSTYTHTLISGRSTRQNKIGRNALFTIHSVVYVLHVKTSTIFHQKFQKVCFLVRILRLGRPPITITRRPSITTFLL